MGISLGYNFEKVQIRRGIYNPKGHFEIEQELNIIRKGFVAIFAGKLSLPMAVTSFPDMEPTPEIQAANRLLIELVEKEYRKQFPPEKH